MHDPDVTECPELVLELCETIEDRIARYQETDPFFSKEKLAYIEKSVNELRSGSGEVHEFIEVEDE